VNWPTNSPRPCASDWSPDPHKASAFARGLATALKKCCVLPDVADPALQHHRTDPMRAERETGPFPAQPGELSFRSDSSSERRPGDVCLRRRCAPQALSAGGDRQGRAGLANRNVPNGGEPILRLIGACPRARRSRSRRRTSRAGWWSCWRTTGSPAPGAPAAVEAIASARLKNDEVEPRDLGGTAARRPALGGMASPIRFCGTGPAGPAADAEQPVPRGPGQP